MSAIDEIDDTINEMITDLHREFKYLRPSEERKSQIVKEIAELRASLNPQCDHKK